MDMVFETDNTLKSIVAEQRYASVQVNDESAVRACFYLALAERLIFTKWAFGSLYVYILQKFINMLLY